MYSDRLVLPRAALTSSLAALLSAVTTVAALSLASPLAALLPTLTFVAAFAFWATVTTLALLTAVATWLVHRSALLHGGSGTSAGLAHRRRERGV
jgi:hypothetical protein